MNKKQYKEFGKQGAKKRWAKVKKVRIELLDEVRKYVKDKEMLDLIQYHLKTRDLVELINYYTNAKN